MSPPAAPSPRPVTPRPMTLRPVALGVLLAVLLVAGTALVSADGPADVPAEPADDRRLSGPAVDRTGPLGVLRAWDRDRAAAWHAGDVRALGRLYVPGSRAGRADRAMLRSYVERGLRVTGLRMQVASAEVQQGDDHGLVLLVTDRLAGGAAAAGPDGALSLPQDRWSSRRVVLERTGGRWRVAEVTDQTRPAASTASTSGSENP